MSAWSKHKPWTVKPLSISNWSGQEQCRGSVCVCVCAHGGGRRAERQMRKCQSAHITNFFKLFFSSRSHSFPNTQKKTSTKDFGSQLTPFLKVIFSVDLKFWSAAHSNSYDNVTIKKGPSINTQVHVTSTKLSWGMLTEMLWKWEILWMSLDLRLIIALHFFFLSVERMKRLQGVSRLLVGSFSLILLMVNE